MKALCLLSVNGEQAVLQKQVKELKERNEDSEYLVKAKLQERDDQIETLMKKQERFENLIQSLIDSGQLKPSITSRLADIAAISESFRSLSK